MTEQLLIQQPPFSVSLRYFARKVLEQASERGDMALEGIGVALKVLADSAEVLEAELVEAKEKVRICEQQTDRIDAENMRLRKQIAAGRCADCDEMERSLDLNEDLDDDALDAMMRTTNDAMVRQLNDVLDVDAGLSEILTRHEGEL